MNNIITKNHFLAILLCALCAGCAAVHPDAYNSADAPTKLISKEGQGVRVSVDVVLEGARGRRYFGTDAAAKGIIPVFVRVENITGPGSFLVEKEQFAIALTAANTAQFPLNGSVENNPSTAAGVMAAGGVLLLSGPMLIAGSVLVSTADAVRHAFVEKELRNQSLAPGRSVEGFVYYILQNKSQPLNDLSLSIPVRNLQNDQVVIHQFTIKNENTKRP